MEIENKKLLDKWMNERRRLGHDIRAIKGPPPPGATYSDGTPILRDVNIAWQDVVNGEVLAIEYGPPA
jgi:hypothetical protein